MTDESPDLDPAIVAALRDVPPADAGIRELHLATALAEVNGTAVRNGSRRATRWLSVAAAALVLLGVGFITGSASRGSGVGSATANGETTSNVDSTLIVKGGGAGGDAAGAAAPGTTSPCPVESTMTLLMRFETASGRMVAYVRTTPSPAIIVMDESTCSILREIDLP